MEQILDGVISNDEVNWALTSNDHNKFLINIQSSDTNIGRDGMYAVAKEFSASDIAVMNEYVS